jgi:putative ABC transport system ATP-binding protein
VSSTLVRRHLDAPRARVYRALVDPRAVAAWMAPPGMTSEVHAFEAREGGAFRISLTYDAATGVGKTTARSDTFHGRFVKLVPDEQVVEVVELETGDPALQGEMTVALSLTDADGGTDLVVVHDRLPLGLSPADNELGWQQSLAKLAALVEAGARGRGEPILRTEALTRVVDGRAIVDGISIDVAEGDVLAIVGPSGSGKSSFLRLLNRLDEPTSGTVYLDGRDYRTIPPRELRRRVGMVLQTAYLFPGTIAENVAFGPAQRGEALREADVASLLEQVGLPGLASRSIEGLSGGEAQRVALARALANSPAVLLADEPTSALDEDSKRDVEALIADVVRARGLTCLVVTHDQAQAARMARRVMVIEAGRLVRIGPLEEVLRAQGMG